MYLPQNVSSADQVMPTNLYGPNDNCDLDNWHVLPVLIRKMHEAKVIITLLSTYGELEALCGNFYMLTIWQMYVVI